MLFNVYDLDNQLIGQVEADNSADAWIRAKEMYQTADRFILDVRSVELEAFEVSELPHQHRRVGQAQFIAINLREADWRAVVLALRRAKDAFKAVHMDKEADYILGVENNIIMQGNFSW